MTCDLLRCLYTSTTSEKPGNSFSLCFGCRDPYLDCADRNISPCKKCHNEKKNSTHENTVSVTIKNMEKQKKILFFKKNVCKVMLLRKVPNTEDNEKRDHRFDLCVNDSVS